jgi:hypothetical protein
MSVDKPGAKSLTFQEQVRGFRRVEGSGDTFLANYEKGVAGEHQPSID